MNVMGMCVLIEGSRIVVSGRMVFMVKVSVDVMVVC